MVAPLSDSLVGRIVYEFENGQTCNQIARAHGLAVSTVARYVKKAGYDNLPSLIVLSKWRRKQEAAAAAVVTTWW